MGCRIKLVLCIIKTIMPHWGYLLSHNGQICNIYINNNDRYSITVHHNIVAACHTGRLHIDKLRQLRRSPVYTIVCLRIAVDEKNQAEPAKADQSEHLSADHLLHHMHVLSNVPVLR